MWDADAETLMRTAAGNGFDGIELGNYLSPRLTTVRQARERIADRSLEILLSDIAGERPAVHELLPFDIVEGESAAKIAR